MKVVKKINNNVAMAIDNNGDDVIIMGKGLGFYATPYELTDVSKIDRYFYGAETKYYDLFNIIDSDIFIVAGKIADFGINNISIKVNPNIVFTLADHIFAAIKIIKQGIVISNPLLEPVRQLYPTEFEVGEHALKIIKEDLGVEFPEEECGNIALHFINAENGINNMYDTVQATEIISKIIPIVEKEFRMQIDRKSLPYARFILHVRFLVIRHNNKDEISTKNRDLYLTVKSTNPKAYNCVNKMVKFMKDEYGWELDEEEQLYVMLHINRLASCI